MRNNGGPRWKKMMKSGSLNSLDLDHLASFPDHRQSKTLLFKKPVAAAAATLHDNKPDESPNYMKSTSSSIARRENLHSSHQRRFSLDESCYLKLTSSSAHKSLCSPKMPITKKVVRKDFEVTFLSSSMKDSRFHPNVMLHSPGNEYEGTSVKACRYPCCSLNSHPDDLLPLPKCFLLARSRFMMTQKTARIKATLPDRTKTSEQRKKDSHANQKEFNGNTAMESHGDHEAQKDFDANLEEVLKVKLQAHDHFNGKISSELAGPMEEQEEAIEVKHVLVETETSTNRKDVEYIKSTDGMRNGEEWMLDYALAQAINKLTPAQKKKVTLLVEAFEMIIPEPKYKSCTEQQIHLPAQDSLGHCN